MTEDAGSGSKDGSTAGDNDQPFTFGQKPSAEWPAPFKPRQFGRLLILRGKVRDRKDPVDVPDPIHPEAA